LCASAAWAIFSLATPAVRAVARHFETSEIDYIVGRGMKDAVTGIPYLRM
jgi:hypothetical protein